MTGVASEESEDDLPRPSRGRAIAAIVGLLWGLAIDAMLVGVSAWGSSPRSPSPSPSSSLSSAPLGPHLGHHDVAVMAVAVGLGLGLLSGLLLRIVLFLIWLHRSVRVALTVGTTRPRVTLREAMTCWFIPFVNLIRPYTVVRSVCRASLPRARVTKDLLTREPWILPAWWVTMLASNLLSSATLGTPLDTPLLVVAILVSAFATACAVLIVWSVHVRQELLFAEAQPTRRAFEPPASVRQHDEEDEEYDDDDDDDDDDD